MGEDLVTEDDIPVGSYRLELQAQWPLVFESLASVIRYMIGRVPVWYTLEQKQHGGRWELIISRSQSRGKAPPLGEMR